MGKDFVYLASASPRRADLLRQIGVPFQVRPSQFPEDRLTGELPEHCVLRLAKAKADTVWEQLGEDPSGPVLAADTVVVLDGQVLGKPATSEDALAMLEALSGRGHRVLTAVAVRGEHGMETRLNESEVHFRSIASHERQAYCDSGEPFDKAGGYGIQGLGAVFVSRLAGSYSAVMGLPLVETAALLERFGMPAWLTRDKK